MQRWLLFCLFLILAWSACQSPSVVENKLALEIRLSPDSSSVMINQIPAELLAELRENTSDSLLWKQFFAVYPEPEDPDMRDFQKALAGTYGILKDGVFFKPNQPFEKGQSYLVLVYAQNKGLNLADLFQKKPGMTDEKPLEYKFRY